MEVVPTIVMIKNYTNDKRNDNDNNSFSDNNGEI